MTYKNMLSQVRQAVTWFITAYVFLVSPSTQAVQRRALSNAFSASARDRKRQRLWVGCFFWYVGLCWANMFSWLAAGRHLKKHTSVPHVQENRAQHKVSQVGSKEEPLPAAVYWLLVPICVAVVLTTIIPGNSVRFQRLWVGN